MTKAALQFLHARWPADFYRCADCSGLFTLLDCAEFFTSNRRGLCSRCNSMRHRELNPEDLRWHEWLTWRVWKFSLLRWANRI